MATISEEVAVVSRLGDCRVSCPLCGNVVMTDVLTTVRIGVNINYNMKTQAVRLARHHMRICLLLTRLHEPRES